MRVVVAASRPVVRAGLGALAEDAGAEVVAEVDAAGALDAGVDLEADVVVLQLGPELELELVSSLAAALRPAALVCLVEEPAWASGVVAAGASALAADTSAATLATALEAAAAGLLVLEPGLAQPEGEGPASAPAGEYPVEALTPRELEVLQLLAQGLTNPRIARELGISQHTVKFHVTSVLGKLGAGTRAEAVARGMRLGWVLV